MFSSGTTGKPKCIVHGIGGTLLQHLKEHILLCDVKPGDRVFYFTTCGWMMWNWLISALASQATLLLYDGSPFARSEEHTSELQSLMRISYAVFCLKKKNKLTHTTTNSYCRLS